jgi:tetratricopeptide (TPR) repeat protein
MALPEAHGDQAEPTTAEAQPVAQPDDAAAEPEGDPAAEPEGDAAAEPEGDEDSPWSKGVSESARMEARALHAKGNLEYKEYRYSAALVFYRQALELWAHPAIRLNMSHSLANQGQPLEAMKNLELAMQYGAEPLGAKRHKLGLSLEKMLRTQLVRFEVTCSQSGAEVTLDGKPLLSCPGRAEKWAEPGVHQIVAEKDGFMTYVSDITAFGGDLRKEDVLLVEDVKVETRTVRRWRPWVPWAVAGAGAAVFAVGVPLQLAANDNFDEFDAYVSAECSDQCDEIPADIAAKKDRGETFRALGITTYALGAAGIITGVVLVLVNRPRVVEAPTLSIHSNGSSLTWRF